MSAAGFKNRYIEPTSVQLPSLVKRAELNLSHTPVGELGPMSS